MRGEVDLLHTSGIADACVHDKDHIPHNKIYHGTRYEGFNYSMSLLPSYTTGEKRTQASIAPRIIHMNPRLPQYAYPTENILNLSHPLPTHNSRINISSSSRYLLHPQPHPQRPLTSRNPALNSLFLCLQRPIIHPESKSMRTHSGKLHLLHLPHPILPRLHEQSR